MGIDDFGDSDSESEHCVFPRLTTSFSSIEELTLSQEQSLLKLVKRLTNNFQLPSFTEQELEESIPQIRDALEYYVNTKWELNPESYFKLPKQQPLICVSSPVPLSNGEVRDITFKTHFETANPAYRDRLITLPKSRSVKAKHWKHLDRRPLGCIIAVHGWMLGDEKASAMTLVPGYFYRMGLDVVVVELPLHGSRSPENCTPLTMFPSVDPAVTNESFAQSICELREIAHWVNIEIGCPLIALGLSLGAQVVSLWASLDKLDAVIGVAPLVSLPNFIWSQVLGTALENSLIKAGLGLELIEKGFAPSNPKSYSLQIDKSRVLLIAGKNDVIVPSKHAEELWSHWNEPKIFWLEDGHIEQLLAEGTAHQVHNFLFRLGLADENLSLATKFLEKN